MVHIFSCCLEVSITSTATGYRNEVPRKCLLVLNDRLKLTGIHNSNSFDNPRVNDLQVRQALGAGVFQDSVATSRRSQEHVQLWRQLPALCRDSPAHSKGQPP